MTGPFINPLPGYVEGKARNIKRLKARRDRQSYRVFDYSCVSRVWRSSRKVTKEDKPSGTKAKSTGQTVATDPRLGDAAAAFLWIAVPARLL